MQSIFKTSPIQVDLYQGKITAHHHHHHYINSSHNDKKENNYLHIQYNINCYYTFYNEEGIIHKYHR